MKRIQLIESRLRLVEICLNAEQKKQTSMQGIICYEHENCCKNAYEYEKKIQSRDAENSSDPPTHPCLPGSSQSAGQTIVLDMANGRATECRSSQNPYNCRSQPKTEYISFFNSSRAEGQKPGNLMDAI